MEPEVINSLLNRAHIIVCYCVGGRRHLVDVLGTRLTIN